MTFSVEGGALPSGLDLDPVTGEVNGTPTGKETAQSTVRATNVAGSDEREFMIEVGRAPSILTETLPAGIVGVDYDETIRVSGTEPVTLKLTEGALPDGLVFDDGAGVISGTPTTEGIADFTITATNAQGTDAQDYGVVVGAVPDITTAELPGVCEEYDVMLESSGTAPVAWSVEEGALPEGLELNRDDGRVSGAASIAGAYEVAIAVDNAFGADSVRYQFEVTPAALATLALNASATSVDEGDSVTLRAAGADEFGNSLGDVRSEKTFTIPRIIPVDPNDPGGSGDGADDALPATGGAGSSLLLGGAVVALLAGAVLIGIRRRRAARS